MFFGSFGDEAAQVVFALRLADGSDAAPAQVSALLAAGLIGGIFAGAVTPRAVVRLGARRLVTLVFVAEAALIAFASFVNAMPWYLAVSAALGCLGSVLWATIMIALPNLTVPGASIDRANRLVQTVRNLGYVVGPLLGSALFAWSSGTRGLFVLALAMFAAALGAAIALPSLVGADVGKESPQSQRTTADVRGLLQTRGVARAIAPLVATVLVTSALNVLLIIRLRSDLGHSTTIYGVVVAALSIGLVAGPALFAGLLGRLGEAAGASVAAATIGVGIAVIGAVSAPWQLGVAAILVGLANGVQNTLMAAFVMKRVDAAHRASRMPAYVLILQCTVFAGFVGAAFVDVASAGSALFAVGTTAVVAGGVGAFANRASKQQTIKDGAPQ